MRETESISAMQEQVRMAIITAIQYREAEGVTVKTLAKSIGVSERKLVRMLQPGYDLDVRSIATMAHHLNMKPTYRLRPPAQQSMADLRIGRPWIT